MAPIPLVALALATLTARVLLGFHGHSGYGKPPMFGDFEAQRHWVEITSALPPAEWYRNSTRNDLQYWGLDYPPLSAWHALAIGKAARWALSVAGSEGESAWQKSFGLFVSRGAEDPQTRAIMRTAALITDVVCYLLPALGLITSLAQSASEEKGTRPGRFSTASSTIATFLLLCPLPLLLIDHGHFQFNSVPLGLTLLAIWVMTAHSRLRRQTAGLLIGVAAVAAAIMFKQMALYYSLGMSAHVLRFTLDTLQSRGLARAAMSFIAAVIVGLSVVGATLAPPLIASDVLTRMFPFQRGLYEDKVANLWCSLSPVLKLHRIFPDRSRLLMFCTLSTIAMCAPACLGYLLRGGTPAPGPRRHAAVARLGLLLTCSALGFFLCSFQVHEKSILLAVVPALIAGMADDRLRTAAVTFHGACIFSLFHLAQKDGLTSAYWSVLVLSAAASLWCSGSDGAAESHDEARRWVSMRRVAKVSYHSFWLLVFAYHSIEAVYVPGDRWPDMAPMVLSILSCASFLCAWAVFTLWIWIL